MTFDAPIDRHREIVRPEWIDYNGHMNVAYYVLVFDHGVDTFFDLLGIGEDYRRAANCSTFALESHICYLREVHEGDSLRVTTQLLDCDDKRIHYFLAMYQADKGYLAATAETISIHVDMVARRSAPFSDAIRRRLQELREAHAELPRPPQAGRTIGIRRSG